MLDQEDLEYYKQMLDEEGDRHTERNLEESGYCQEDIDNIMVELEQYVD